MKKCCLVAILVFGILLAQNSFSQELGKALVFRVSWEKGEYSIDNVSMVIGEAPKPYLEAQYLVKLKNQEKKTIYQTTVRKINVELVPSIMPGIEEVIVLDENQKEEFIIDYDEIFGTFKGQMFLMVPYVEEAKYLTFGHGKAVLAKFDLGKLCNRNNVCGENENHLSCPQDCKADEMDGYCVHFADNICDPDCIEGIDPDCEEKGEEPIKPDYVAIAIFSGIALVLILVFLRSRKME